MTMMSILSPSGVLYGIDTLAPPIRVTGHVIHVPSAFRVKRGRGQRRNRRNAGWRKPNRRLSPSELEQSLAKLREMATAWAEVTCLECCFLALRGADAELKALAEGILAKGMMGKFDER